MPGTGVTGSSPSSGSGIWAVCSACARLLKLCSCSSATSCTVKQISHFSQHWAVPFFLTMVHFPNGVLCHLCLCAESGVQTNRGLVLYHCHNPPSARPWSNPCLHYAVLSTWSAVKLDNMGCVQSADSTVCQGKSLWLLSLGSKETEEERPNYKNKILV